MYHLYSILWLQIRIWVNQTCSISVLTMVKIAVEIHYDTSFSIKMVLSLSAEIVLFIVLSFKNEANCIFDD